METYTINTISDREGIKQVFTCDGVSKLYYFGWYPFEREIKQHFQFEIKEIQAEGFNHALDLLKWENQKNSYKNDYKQVSSRLKAIEGKILQKFGKKLKGKADKSKINSFLR